MVLLGWSLDGSTDVIPMQTIIDNFTLDRITKSAAIFDQDKLMWMNGVYIRELTSGELAKRMAPFLERDLPEDSTPVDREYLPADRAVGPGKAQTVGRFSRAYRHFLWGV